MTIQKVLVVDDSKSQRALLAAVLAQAHCEVITAADGSEGITMAKSHLPDLILMDVVMPNLNGFQATRVITTDETTWHIPVILLTSKDMESDRIWGMRQGATAFLNKPVDIEELLALINALR